MDDAGTGSPGSQAGSQPPAGASRRAHAPELADPDHRGADEAAAEQARVRYRREEMVPLPVDAAVAGFFAPSEQVLAVRHMGRFDRSPFGSRPDSGDLADVYLTTSRLVLHGHDCLDVGLDEIREVVLAGDRLFIDAGHLGAIALDVPQPRLLRVEIAAARVQARH
jgi:hypothetical protein